MLFLDATHVQNFIYTCGWIQGLSLFTYTFVTWNDPLRVKEKAIYLHHSMTHYWNINSFAFIPQCTVDIIHHVHSLSELAYNVQHYVWLRTLKCFLLFICHTFSPQLWYIGDTGITWKGPSWWSYCSWIYNYLCNQCLSPLKLWVQILLKAGCTWYNIMW